MATDAYMQIDGIKGESIDDRHKGWIEISRVTWNVSQPRASSVSTAGGHTTGRADLSEFSFRKIADIASPLLLQTCAMGKTIPKARVEFLRADGEGKPITYFVVEMENVMIAGVTPSSGETGLLEEQVHLAYARIKWNYTKQSIHGGAEGNTSGGWDTSANKPI